MAAATELPLMVYNNPLASGVDLEPGTLAEIAAHVPGVACSRSAPATSGGSPS